MMRRWLPAALWVLPLLAQGPPVIYPGGVVNAAHYGRPIARGSIASIFGENLARRTAAAEGYPLPKDLAGVRVRVGGYADSARTESAVVEAPLFFVSPGQINFMFPSGVSPLLWSPEYLEVENEFGVSERYFFDETPILRRAPGIFTLDASGCGPPAVLNVAPDRSVSVNSPANSAEPGGILTVFLTGLGAHLFQPPDGEPIPTDRVLWLGGVETVVGREGYVNWPYLKLDEEEPRTLFAGKAPGVVGVDQVNVRLPATVEQGCYVPLRFTRRIFEHREARLGSQVVYVSVRSGGGRCRDRLASFGLVRWNVTLAYEAGAVVEVAVQFLFGPGNLQPRFENPEGFSDFPGNDWLGFNDIGPLLTAPAVSCLDPRPRRLLDAGTLTVTGPSLPVAELSRVETAAGPRYRGKWVLEQFQPGGYTVRASGGEGVGPFESTIELPAPVTPKFDFPPGTEIDTSKPMTFRWSGGDERSRVLIDLESWQPGKNFLRDRYVLVAARATRGELTFAHFTLVPPRRWQMAIGSEDQLRFTLRQRTKDESTAEKFSADGLSLGGWQMFEYRWVWDGLIPAPSE